MKIKYCLIILLLLVFVLQTAHSEDANQSIFNERLNSLQKIHKEGGYCDLSKLDLGKLKQFVELNRDKKVAFF